LYDTDNRDEIMHMLQNIVDQLISQWDKDGDGMLNFEEFFTMSKSMNIIKYLTLNV